MKYDNVYFIGIGGIGMSALARYFRLSGCAVAGYDRVQSQLCRQLETEGMQIHYTDSVAQIPTNFTADPARTLVVYTPAVPADHTELGYFRHAGFEVVKRSQILGVITEGKFCMAVAGTHGKTTTTTMIAHFNRVATGGGSAFLGGISKNFNSNLVYGTGDRVAVEADEFDRSFLQLHPDVACVTSADADHLDIYGTHEAVREAFSQFISQVKPGGSVVMKLGLDLPIYTQDIRFYRYSLDTPTDFYTKNIRLGSDGHYTFDMVCPDTVITDCRLGIPGRVNIENCVAAVALMWCSGELNHTLMRQAIDTFSGVRRRFDFYVNTPQRVYFDDYAHHPRELRAALESIRAIYPHRRLTVIFQPHLYSRTRDFASEFSAVLSLADRVILLPIYPAREEPIPGVNSEMLLDAITCSKILVPKDQLLEQLRHESIDVLGTFGAGDIDAFCEPISEMIKNS